MSDFWLDKGMSQNQGEEFMLQKAMSVKQAITVQSEFSCFISDNVFLIASYEVPQGKHKDQSFIVAFGLIVIFTNLA